MRTDALRPPVLHQALDARLVHVMAIKPLKVYPRDSDHPRNPYNPGEESPHWRGYDLSLSADGAAAGFRFEHLTVRDILDDGPYRISFMRLMEQLAQPEQTTRLTEELRSLVDAVNADDRGKTLTFRNPKPRIIKVRCGGSGCIVLVYTHISILPPRSLLRLEVRNVMERCMCMSAGIARG